MHLNLERPLAFFDLEATGINTVKDRIVEISVVKLLPEGEKQPYTKRVNPGCPIPAETTRIHGIADADVADAPTFADIAKEVARFLDGCDLCGYNALKFDLPLLVEEFLRADVRFDLEGRRIVDAQRIFYLMEPRTLTAAYKFFCGKELVNAHSAEADTLATLEVLQAQVQRYEGVSIKDRDGKEYQPVKNDVAALHKLTVDNLYDLAGRMVYNDEGVVVFNFGKHRKKPVLDVLAREPSYYDWIMKGEFPLDTKQRLTELKLSQFNKGNFVKKNEKKRK